MRKGFTLIEVLVATMLLAMLVTILTMIFNQSSIAWTTGMAAVTSLGDSREKISVCMNESENAILNDAGTEVLRITSIWKENGTGLRDEGRTLRTDFEEPVSAVDLADPRSDRLISVAGGSVAGGDTFLVGVHSYGPDGKTGGDYSWDDISTMPEEIVR